MDKVEKTTGEAMGRATRGMDKIRRATYRAARIDTVDKPIYWDASLEVSGGTEQKIREVTVAFHIADGDALDEGCGRDRRKPRGLDGAGG